MNRLQGINLGLLKSKVVLIVTGVVIVLLIVWWFFVDDTRGKQAHDGPTASDG